MSLASLVAISRRYGSDPGYVVAGGGNTSWKDKDTLYIKGSGTALAQIDESGFVKMDRAKLAAIWNKQYPADIDARESAVLADLMASRLPGEESKRPSVETLLHDILPFSYVVHTHPALVNGLTCSRQGEGAMIELFGKDAIWIPSTNPGYILSSAVKDALAAFEMAHRRLCPLIFLQNHGVFIAADTVAGIDALYEKVMLTLAKKCTRTPDISGALAMRGPSVEIGARIQSLSSSNSAVSFQSNPEVSRIVASKEAFAPVSSAFTPDHIVYAGSDPLFVEAPEGTDAGAAISSLESAWKQFTDAKKRNPKLVAVQGIGIFGIGSSEKAASLAVDLFLDAIKVSVYTEAFGGPQFMSQEQIDFINNWEVERYRAKISTGR